MNQFKGRLQKLFCSLLVILMTSILTSNLSFSITCQSGFIPSGKKCIRCINSKAVSNQCVCNKGYVKSTATACKVCPNGQIVSNGSCQSCPSPQVPNSTKSACMTCPSGQISTSSFICKTCSTGQRSSRDNACVSCGLNEIVSGNKCVACAEDTSPDTNRTSCVSPHCQSHATWNTDDIRCSCDSGYFENTDNECDLTSSSSDTNSPICTNGTFNKDTKKCDCDSGYGPSPDGGSCVQNLMHQAHPGMTES